METKILQNVLVVEENNDTRQMINRCLGTFSLNVDEAADGAAAIIHINRKVYDLVLLDMETFRGQRHGNSCALA